MFKRKDTALDVMQHDAIAAVRTHLPDSTASCTLIHNFMQAWAHDYLPIEEKQSIVRSLCRRIFMRFPRGN